LKHTDTFSLTALRPIGKDPWPVVVWCRLFAHRLRRPWLRWRHRRETARVLARQSGLQECDAATLAELQQQAAAAARKRWMGTRRKALLEALALVCELARRELSQQPYAVQVMAALAMHDGYLVQLAPGEGKTLTLGLVGVLRGWERRPCHIITANDYLACRDAEALRPLYHAAGLTVAAVHAEMEPAARTLAYAEPVIYATAKQLLADHLTDRVHFGARLDRLSVSIRLLQGRGDRMPMLRGLYTAIVDEADHILIDEAVTPMIIAQPEADVTLQQAVHLAHAHVDALQAGVHYRLRHQDRDVEWLVAGIERIEQWRGQLPGPWRGRSRAEDLMRQAVLARDCFIRDQHYVVLDDQVVIVDEGTGRSMPGRSWSYGLHQAVEARAGVPLTDPSRTLARLGFQTFFQQYVELTGASGTLQNVDYEICFSYGRRRLVIPPRVPSRLRIHPLVLFATRRQRLEAVVDRVLTLAAADLPVLVGTRSVADSEAVQEALATRGLHCQLLNAKQPEVEAEVIAAAGEPGRITVATNMAGRGTDIKPAPTVLARGGLRVIMFEPHESARVDWQLFGRAGRQGQPGEVFRFAACDDLLLTHHLDRLSRSMASALSRIGLQAFGANVWVGAAQLRATARAFRLRRTLNRMTRERQERMTFTRSE